LRVEKETGSELAQMATQTWASLSVSCKQSGVLHMETGQQDADMDETEASELFIDLPRDPPIGYKRRLDEPRNRGRRLVWSRLQASGA
jgi:hypothetical protein